MNFHFLQIINLFSGPLHALHTPLLQEFLWKERDVLFELHYLTHTHAHWHVDAQAHALALTLKHAHSRIRTCTKLHSHALMDTRTQACTQTNANKRTHTLTHSHTCTHRCPPTHIHTRAHTQVHTHTYAHTHARTHTLVYPSDSNVCRKTASCEKPRLKLKSFRAAFARIHLIHD